MSHKFKGSVQVESNLTLSLGTANRVPVLDASKNVVSSSVTDTELGHLSGVTSGIQTQLNDKAADADVIKKNGSVAFTADQSMGGFKLTNLGTPTSSTDAVTKAYADSVANGLSWKSPVLVATTANITLSGEQTIDGVLTSTSRVLVKNQSDATQNGIYVSDSGAWARAADMDAYSEFPSAAVFVEQGTDNGDKGFVCTSDSGGTLGVTNIVFTQFSNVLYTADGQGIELSSNQFQLELDGGTLSKSSSGVKVADGGISNTQINASAAIDASKIADGSVSSTEFQYLSGVTSDIQTQLNDKASTTLNNLGTTSINADLLVDTQIARNIGSDSKMFNLIKAAGYRTSATVQSFTGDTTSGSAVIANVTDTTGLYVGQEVVGTGIPVAASISSIIVNTSVTLDANATATNTGVSFNAIFPLIARSENQTGSNSSAFAVFGSGTTVSGTSGNTTLSTGNSTSGATGTVNIASGNVSSGSGNSGDVNISSGTVSSGTRGVVKNDASAYHFLGANPVQLYDSDNSNSIGLKSPSSVTTSVDYILPEDGTSGYVLSTNGSGTLSWVKNNTTNNDILETSFSLANNQTSPVDVTGFAFSNANVRSFESLVSVVIDATSDLFEVFTLRGIQRGSDWDMSVVSNGDDSQVVFSITNAGQVQYTSGNYSGFSVGTIKFRALTTSV